MIAATIRMRRQGRERSAGRACAPDRSDRSVRQPWAGPTSRSRRAPAARDQYQLRRARPAADDADDDGPPAGPPPWMQRAANRQEVPPQQDYPPPDYPSCGASAAALCGARMPRPSRTIMTRRHIADEPISEPDPSRYDDALYGQLDTGAQEPSTIRPMRTTPTPIRTAMTTAPKSRPRSAAAAWSPWSSFLRWRWWERARRLPTAPMSDRRAAASRRSSGPTPARPRSCRRLPTATAKVPDRMATGDGTEKIVPREEAPVDVNAKSGPRVVFPPLNQNGNPPSAASVAPGGPPPATAGNGTLPNNEPRKIKTLTVRGDQPDGAAAPVTSAPPAAAKPAPAARPPARRRRRAAGSPPRRPMPAPMRRCRWSPQAAQPAPAAEPRTRVATTNPGADRARSAAAGGSGGYLVQVSSQRNEADAQASFRALQGKFPAVLGSRSAADQARRSRRQGRLLPRHGRPVRVARRGLAVLRQPEDGRRAVRRPKELTAVSLTLGPRSGLIGPHEHAGIHHRRIRTGTERRRARVHPRGAAVGLYPVQAEY